MDREKDLTTRLEENTRAYGMEVSSEKSIVYSTNNTVNIVMNGQNLEDVDSFKYLGSTLSKDGTSTKEIKIRIAVAMSAMSRLNILWKSRYISFHSKFRLHIAFAVSTLLYGYESLTLTADTEIRVQIFETKYSRRLLRSSYIEHKTNEYLESKSPY